MYIRKARVQPPGNPLTESLFKIILCHLSVAATNVDAAVGKKIL